MSSVSGTLHKSQNALFSCNTCLLSYHEYLQCLVTLFHHGMGPKPGVQK